LFSATHHSSAPALHFEADSVEGSLQEMDEAVVGGDDEVAVGPLGVFISADQKFQCELFEDVIVGGLKFVIGKRAENGARFGDVLRGGWSYARAAVRGMQGRAPTEGQDAFGRVTSSIQNTGSNQYSFQYQYSLTDPLTQITYPSGTQVSYTPDSADRIQTVQNVKTGITW
jgi:hypothetical protein